MAKRWCHVYWSENLNSGNPVWFYKSKKEALLYHGEYIVQVTITETKKRKKK